MNVGSKALWLRFILIPLIATALSGCGIEASIVDLNEKVLVESQRVEPDFVASEVVTTNKGVIVRGSFGEISEKKILSNNVAIEGAFYE
ncbi:hypothetical protein [Bdellovibrio sp.]|uniref:hypothetical protein n=1 Tax=Bdellovibrio sp. TaxID=28201 RepID=UPI0032214267